MRVDFKKKMSREALYQRLIIVASQSPARKRKVGAIIAYETNNSYVILSEGYNFNPSGGPCETEDNVSHPNVVHAEVNAIENIDYVTRYMLNHKDCDSYRYKMFTTHQPCTGCLAHLKEANLTYEVWRKVMTNNIEDTLKERGDRYGDFSDNARVHQALLNVMMAEYGWSKLSDVHRTALDVFCQKQARILNGDPHYTDNWHDIAGYAKLAEDRCIAPVETKKMLVESPKGREPHISLAQAYGEPGNFVAGKGGQL